MENSPFNDLLLVAKAWNAIVKDAVIRIHEKLAEEEVLDRIVE